MAVLAAQEQQPLAIGRPARTEVECVARLDLFLLRAVGIRDVDLIVLVVADTLTIRRRAVSVREARALSRNITFVPSIQIHDEWFRHAVDQRRETETAPCGRKNRPPL